jgi:CelD/BcsL family acetyltransferase involved in cellulose biosynthesis
MPAAVRVVQFEEIEREWVEMLPACTTNTVFVTPWWQRTWWRHFGDGSELRLLSVRNDRELLGIAPLKLTKGVLGFLGGSDVSDYGDFLVPKGRERAFYGALFDYLQAAEWRVLNLSPLPQGSETLRHIPSIAKERGYGVEVREEGMAPIASLPPSWDEYLAGLSKRDRHELRRKLRRFESAGITRQYVCESPQDIGERMQDFFRLHRASRQDKAAFMTPDRERFFMDISLELSARDQLRLAFLELDGVTVASCISFDYLDSYLLYNSGYDPRYSNLSVGLLNKALTIKEAIERGRLFFDFLRGSERYKYDLGATDRAVYQLVVSRS